MAEIAPIQAQRALAAALRDLRDASGMSAAALGQKVGGWSQSKVSKIENGATKPSSADVHAWTTATGASPQRTEELLNLAEQIHTVSRTWRRAHGRLASLQRRVAQIEAEATSVRSFEPQAVPGLMQVPGYAQHIYRIIEGDGDSSEWVADRLNRQGVLFRPGKRFEFVLGEGALLWRAAGMTGDLLAEQAERIALLAARPNVSVSVLPYSVGWSVLPAASMTVYETPDGPKVLIETSRGDDILSDPDEAAHWLAQVDAAAADAVTGGDALALVRGLLV